MITIVVQGGGDAINMDNEPLQVLDCRSTLGATYLPQIGFRMSKSDNSLYVRHNSRSLIVIILYVDDLVIGGESLVDKSLLSGKFEMTDMKELHYFLGIEVIRIPVGIMISQ